MPYGSGPQDPRHHASPAAGGVPSRGAARVAARPPTPGTTCPHYACPKVHRDYHIEVDRALYSVPAAFIGCRVKVRADRHLVRIYHHGVLIKTHPRTAPGGRVTDPADLPPERAAYAARDLDRLRSTAAANGPAVGAVAAAVLEGPLPWTRMRRVYRLRGLVRRYRADRVEAACAKALELEAPDVSLIARIVERGAERQGLPAPPAPGRTLAPLRFARPEEEFLAHRGRTG